MGPICNNYGTFVAPSGPGAVEFWREEGDVDSYQNQAPAFERATAPRVDHCLRRDWEGNFGLRLRKHEKEVVISEIDDDVARDRGLREGDVVTHIDGRPLLSSLRTAAQYIDRAGDSLVLRIQSTGGENSSRRSNGHHKTEYQVVQHVVRQGDSVETLALLYGTPADQIRSDNRKHFPVGEPGFLFPGQIVVLRAKAAGFATKNVHEAGDETPRIRKSEGGSRRRRMLYEVLEGDSLETICARLGVRDAEIRNWNRSIFPIGEAGVVYPGQTLAIFTSGGHGLCEDEELGRSEAEEESERTLSKQLAKQKSRRYSLGSGMHGARVTG